MTRARTSAVRTLFASLQRYERLYQFRDPNNACLFDLRINECYMLDLIIESGPMSVAALAERLGIHKSNASRIARALQAKGFAEETGSPQDRRRVLWQVTEKGHERFAQIADYLVGRFEETLQDFSSVEIARFAAAVTRLAGDAEARLGAPCVPDMPETPDAS